MKIDFAFLADAAAPALGGKFDALGIGVRELVVNSLPAVHPALAVVVRFEREETDPNELSLSVRLVDAKEHVIERVQQPLPHPGLALLTLVLSMSSIRVESVGAHRVELAVSVLAEGLPEASPLVARQLPLHVKLANTGDESPS